jgi:predicted metal-dependent peptidase
MVSAWNLSHDYVINQIISEMSKENNGAWCKVPDHAAQDAKYKDWSAEEVYDDILENTPAFEGFFLNGDGARGDSPEGDEWKQYLLNAIQDHKSRRGGHIPNALQIYVDLLIPKVSWAEKLAQWTGENYAGVSYDYKRPSRREGATNCVLAAANHANAPYIIVLWDTSGSMAGHVNMVFSELDGILQSTRAPIRVILCDTAIRGDFPALREAQELAQNVEGGGGSDFTPAFQAVENTDCLVIAFTDGDITVPEDRPCAQVLWVLTADGRDPTEGKWGDVMHLPDI